jgi:hypothetical protein
MKHITSQMAGAERTRWLRRSAIPTDRGVEDCERWLVETPTVVNPEPERAPPMSGETAERLRSLGYLR